MNKNRFLVSLLTVLLSAMVPLSPAFEASASIVRKPAAAAKRPLVSKSVKAQTASDPTYPGFRVKGRFLYDSNGEKVILYGINKMCIWTDIDGEPAFSEIAKTGANCVRIVWGTDGTAQQLDTVITNCRREHMIPIVELHDATGDWSKLPSLVDYWVRPDILAVLKKHEQYLLINIGNEVGNQVSESDFTSGYESAVAKMRDAGIHVPLIIDASSYGQNIKTLEDCGPAIISGDPDKNLMFSVHMYWPAEYGYSAQDVIDGLAKSVKMDLPLLVGEFGNAVDTTEQGKIPYKTIIEYCYKDQIGYLPWEFGPGNHPQTFLDMTTDGTYATLHDWGLDVAVTDTYSIQNIAQRPVSMLSSLPASTPEEPMPAGNLALGRHCVASSLESSGYPAGNITDGDYSTRWSSASSDPGWVYVDLGSKKDITKMIIRWEAAYATQYKIQVSDDAADWTDIYTQYNGEGGTETIPLSGSGRYVRIYGTQRYDSSWGYSIYDVGIYGPDSVESASVSPTVGVFDKHIGNQADMSFTLDAGKNTLNDVRNGDYVLKAGTDYTVSGDVLTVSKSYLATLPLGTARITLDFSGGVAPYILIGIGDTSPNAYLRPSRVEFDLNASAQSDVSVAMASPGNTFTGIKNGTESLVEGKDYIVDENTVTIKKEYLAKQPFGITKLTFNFDNGDDPVLTVNVIDTSPSAEITPETASFDLYNEDDVKVGVVSNGNVLDGLYNGKEELIKGTDYTVGEDGTVTILKSYLAKQKTGTANITFDFSAGIDPVLEIKVVDSRPVNDSEILPTSAPFDCSNPADIPVAVTFNGNTFVDIRKGVTVLKDGADYTVSADGTVTISKDYLSTLPNCTAELVFDFSAGRPQTLTVSVANSSVAPVENGNVEVQEFSYNPNTTSNTISVNYQLTNKGDTAVDLSKLSLRYYFTEEGNEDETYTCDWCQLGQDNVIGTFVKMDPAAPDAGQYLNIAFSSASGSLAPGQSVNVTGRVYKSLDWGNYDQSNDYSFSAGSGYADNDKVTAYLDGTLIWGAGPKV